MLKKAFTIMEILVAITVISVAMIPILYMSSRNVEGAKVDRVRLVCEALCRSMLERFGRTADFPWGQLSPTGDPQVRVGVDLWRSDEDLSEVLDEEGLKSVFEYHQVKSIVTVRRNVDPGLLQVTSRVTWMTGRGAFARSRDVSYTRFIFESSTL